MVATGLAEALAMEVPEWPVMRSLSAERRCGQRSQAALCCEKEVGDDVGVIMCDIKTKTAAHEDVLHVCLFSIIYVI